MFGDSRIDSAALDRHITGNYGEDQFAGECFDEDCERFEECPHEWSLDACRDDSIIDKEEE